MDFHSSYIRGQIGLWEYYLRWLTKKIDFSVDVTCCCIYFYFLIQFYGHIPGFLDTFTSEVKSGRREIFFAFGRRLSELHVKPLATDSGGCITHCCKSKSSTSHKIISQQVVLFFTRWTTDGYWSVTHCKVLTTAGKLKSESSGLLA